MALTQAKIFNLALGALLLQRRIVDPETDKSNESKVLLTNWDVAYESTLEDLDLDSTSTELALTLLATDPTTEWDYAYLYPTNCLFLRRIKSIDGVVIDNRSTHEPKLVRMYGSNKAVYTNKIDAIAEYIANDIPINSFSPNLGLAIAYRLALLSAPLIVGKGAKTLMDSIQTKYLIAKAEAQQKDNRENFNFIDERVESEFVEVRTT